MILGRCRGSFDSCLSLAFPPRLRQALQPFFSLEQEIPMPAVPPFPYPSQLPGPPLSSRLVAARPTLLSTVASLARVPFSFFYLSIFLLYVCIEFFDLLYVKVFLFFYCPRSFMFFFHSGDLVVEAFTVLRSLMRRVSPLPYISGPPIFLHGVSRVLHASYAFFTLSGFSA